MGSYRNVWWMTKVIVVLMQYKQLSAYVKPQIKMPSKLLLWYKIPAHYLMNLRFTFARSHHSSKQYLPVWFIFIYTHSYFYISIKGYKNGKGPNSWNYGHRQYCDEGIDRWSAWSSPSGGGRATCYNSCTKRDPKWGDVAKDTDFNSGPITRTHTSRGWYCVAPLEQITVCGLEM
jgi:hypothetical protein